MATMKDDRLQLRIDPAAKQRLERAAEAAHQSVSAFVLQSAELHAEQVLADRLVITLGAPTAEAFATALQRPAQVNERLTAALARPAGFSWLD
ncbi:MAG: DUF1778 domain-containing protein [Pseudonocardiales bacterium]|nr:MAG: DUF1778 domain-containing protein [Pseudonocardiales bacterium]